MSWTIVLLNHNWMNTQSLITIGTPFLVFGAVFVVLILVWDKQ